MTFDEWWKEIKPAECDELKEHFVECWLRGQADGFEKGAAAFHAAVAMEREACAKVCDGIEYDYYRDNKCATAIRKRSNVEIRG